MLLLSTVFESIRRPLVRGFNLDLSVGFRARKVDIDTVGHASSVPSLVSVSQELSYPPESIMNVWLFLLVVVGAHGGRWLGRVLKATHTTQTLVPIRRGCYI